MPDPLLVPADLAAVPIFNATTANVICPELCALAEEAAPDASTTTNPLTRAVLRAILRGVAIRWQTGGVRGRLTGPEAAWLRAVLAGPPPHHTPAHPFTRGAHTDSERVLSSGHPAGFARRTPLTPGTTRVPTTR